MTPRHKFSASYFILFPSLWTLRVFFRRQRNATQFDQDDEPGTPTPPVAAHHTVRANALPSGALDDNSTSLERGHGQSRQVATERPPETEPQGRFGRDDRSYESENHSGPESARRKYQDDRIAAREGRHPSAAATDKRGQHLRAVDQVVGHREKSPGSGRKRAESNSGGNGSDPETGPDTVSDEPREDSSDERYDLPRTINADTDGIPNSPSPSQEAERRISRFSLMSDSHPAAEGSSPGNGRDAANRQSKQRRSRSPDPPDRLLCERGSQCSDVISGGRERRDDDESDDTSSEDDFGKELASLVAQQQGLQNGRADVANEALRFSSARKSGGSSPTTSPPGADARSDRLSKDARRAPPNAISTKDLGDPGKRDPASSSVRQAARASRPSSPDLDDLEPAPADAFRPVENGRGIEANEVSFVFRYHDDDASDDKVISRGAPDGMPTQRKVNTGDKTALKVVLGLDGPVVDPSLTTPYVQNAEVVGGTRHRKKTFIKSGKIRRVPDAEIQSVLPETGSDALETKAAVRAATQNAERTAKAVSCSMALLFVVIELTLVVWPEDIVFCSELGRFFRARLPWVRLHVTQVRCRRC